MPGGDYPDYSLSQSVVLDGGLIHTNALGAMVDTSRYQTMILTISNGSVCNALLVAQYDASGNIITTTIYSADYLLGQYSWAIPVIGTRMQVSNASGGDVSYSISGTANVLPAGMITDMYGADVRAISVASGTPNGTFTRLNSSVASGLNGYFATTPYNGQVAMRWSVGTLGGATTWVLYASIRTETGAQVLIPITETAAIVNKEMLWGHPKQYTAWFIGNTGALTSASSHSLTIIPAE